MLVHAFEPLGEQVQVVVAIALALDEVTKLQEAYRAAIDTLRDAPATGATCVYTAKLELLAAQPDVRFRFVARLNHNWLRDDTTKLGVNEFGLLTSANAVATDRTGDILAEGAGAIAAVGGGASRPFYSQRVGAPATADCAKGQIVLMFDPASPDAVDRLNLEAQLANYPYRVEVRGPVPSSAQAPAVAALADRLQRNRTGAIFYRSPVPMTLILSDKIDGDWRVTDSSIAMIPQAGPISFVPMNSSAFVKTVDDVQFADGAVTSWSTDRPSEVLEVVRLPVKIATAVIQAPAQLLSLRVDYSSKDKALVEAQQADIVARQQMLQLRQCLDKARMNGTDPAACLPAP